MSNHTSSMKTLHAMNVMKMRKRGSRCQCFSAFLLDTSSFNNMCLGQARMGCYAAFGPKNILNIPDYPRYKSLINHFCYIRPFKHRKKRLVVFSYTLFNAIEDAFLTTRSRHSENRIFLAILTNELREH